ncbi:MAG: tRNA 2-thiouridine(34) synthase MnmA [Bdellovibrionales bacterium]
MTEDLRGKKIAVALSGGVDSAVVAALLQEQGAQIIALTLKLEADDLSEDAQRVAAFLGLPLHVIDAVQPFYESVKRDFVETYLRGETPLPCAQCNRFIKFGLLMREAQERGAQALATGHYARRIPFSTGTQLHKAADESKDQSYFLFGLSPEQIDFLRFPLGDLTKEETRRLAERFNLPVAQKKESQDICFVPSGDYVSVLEKLAPGAIEGGDIVDQSGAVLGRHQGIVHFTIGQRKGLNLSARTGDHNEPLFVLRLDAEKKQVIVGPRESLAQREVRLRDMNWLMNEPLPTEGMPVMVRLRSAQQPQDALLFPVEGSPQKARLCLKDPSFGVAPGQAGVLYKESRLLGGGWIERS